MSGKTQRPGAAEWCRAFGHGRPRAAPLVPALVAMATTLGCLLPAGAGARWLHVSAHHSRTQPYYACGQRHSGARCHVIVDPALPTNRRGPVPAGAITAGPELETSPALSGHGVKGGYSPEDLRKAYGKAPEQPLPSTTAGEGQTVAIVDAHDDPNAESDLAHYRAEYELSPCTTANHCFRKVNQSGKSTPPSESAEWGEEISLDVDMVSAICPKCHILLVEANTGSSENLAIAERTAVEMGATEISNSYGSAAGQEPAEVAAYDHPGIPITVAAGDEGYGVEVPADNPHVIAVGGTTLVPELSKSNPRGWKETVWYEKELNEETGLVEIAGTGSGCSEEPKPSWQTEPCLGRINNDVAVVGDQNTPVSTYDSYHPNPKQELAGPWMLEGGTSVGAPIVAAAMALSSSYTRSFDGAHALYIDSLLTKEAFNDVTSGKNYEKCASYLCEARIGYDGPSGLGTLHGPPEAPPPVLVSEGAGSVGAGEATLNGSINPKDASFTECRFEYGPPPSYASHVAAICPSGSPESGVSAVAVSAHVTGLQAATGYHYRLTAVYQGQSSSSGESSFATSGAKPSATTEAASAITTTTATLYAKVNPNGAQVTECRFEYGTSTSYGSDVPCSSSPGSGQGYVAVSAPVTLLAPATPYHFRIVAKNSFGEGEGTDRTFTTGAIQPEVAVDPASAITETDATLNATVNPLGVKITECRFEYGRSPAYEAVAPCSSLPGEGHTAASVSAEISELLPGHTYHFRIVAGNSEKATGSSSDEAFVTVAEPPVAITESALAAGSGSETLTGTVAPNGAAITTCRFEYGTSPAGILEASVPCSALPANTEEGADVSASINGLAAGTTYHYRLVTSNSVGTSYGKTLTFTTAAAKLPGGGGLEESLEGHVQPGQGRPTLASHKLSVNSQGSLRIPVKCPAGSSACAGSISLQAVVALSSSHRHATRHHVVVAAGTFKVSGGRVSTVRLRLSHTARKLLRHSRVLHASATITPAAGKAARTNVTIRSS